jgi:glucose/mannose-6-phosphate isomerase
VNWGERIRRYDRDGFLAVLGSFPEQVEKALEMEASLKRLPRSIVVAGMGGSALGGQLVADLARDQLPVPVIVHRDYSLPAFVKASTLVIASSYSGNTEETLSACQAGIERGAEVIVLTAGGKLRALAESYGLTRLQLPADLPPRMAWAFLSLPVLNTLSRAGFIEPQTEGLHDLVAGLCRALQPQRDNEAMEVAAALRPLIPNYCTSLSTSVLAYKWKINTNENAKHQAFASFLPEANHNEVEAWHYPQDCLEKMALVFLRTDYEGPRLAERIRVSKEILGKGAPRVLEVRAAGRTKLEQLFSSIYTGDFVSYYLALLNRQNPAPVDVVERLKARLAG